MLLNEKRINEIGMDFIIKRTEPFFKKKVDLREYKLLISGYFESVHDIISATASTVHLGHSTYMYPLFTEYWKLINKNKKKAKEYFNRKNEMLIQKLENEKENENNNNMF